MVIQSVKQRGSTLIELMVASLLGLVVLSMIGGFIMTSQTLSMQRSLRLLLAQNMNGAIEQMKRECLISVLVNDYQWRQRMLQQCHDTPNGRTCYDLFEPDQITVDDYQITINEEAEEEIEEGSIHVMTEEDCTNNTLPYTPSELVTLSLTAHITQQPEITQTVQATFRLRNLVWPR